MSIGLEDGSKVHLVSKRLGALILAHYRRYSIITTIKFAIRLPETWGNDPEVEYAKRGLGIENKHVSLLPERDAHEG